MKEKLTEAKVYEHLGMRSVCVDFDKTIVESEYPKIYGVVEGAREALGEFKRHGWYIVIYTARVNSRWGNDPHDEAKKVADYLKENNIPFDEIWQNIGKPFAMLYIDDAAFRFEHSHEFGWQDITRLWKNKFCDEIERGL